MHTQMEIPGFLTGLGPQGSRDLYGKLTSQQGVMTGQYVSGTFGLHLGEFQTPYYHIHGPCFDFDQLCYSDIHTCLCIQIPPHSETRQFFVQLNHPSTLKCYNLINISQFHGNGIIPDDCGFIGLFMLS